MSCPAYLVIKKQCWRGEFTEMVTVVTQMSMKDIMVQNVKGIVHLNYKMPLSIDHFQSKKILK